MGSPTIGGIAASVVGSLTILTDTERPSFEALERRPRGAIRDIVALNSVDALAQGATCLPGLALVGGWANAAYGVGKLGKGLLGVARCDPEASMYLKSGAKSVCLGMWAALDPVNGWWVNAIAAGKDAVDAGTVCFWAKH